MPKKVERALMKAAHKKGYKGERAKEYTYSTMNKLGMLNKALSKRGKKK